VDLKEKRPFWTALLFSPCSLAVSPLQQEPDWAKSNGLSGCLEKRCQGCGHQ